MKQPISMAIHGGAGKILKEKMSPSLEKEYKEKLEESIRAGYALLNGGKSASEAVVAAINVMEDSPLFNAGKGSVFTHEETQEMDAAIMDGQNLNVGAIAGVSHIKNPISLAYDVMTQSEHVFLIKEGAEAFAQSIGYKMTPREYFFTQRRFDQLIKMKNEGKTALSECKEDAYPDDKKHGTVGAVALDRWGNLAAGTSTGGITNKKFGRVGDSPIIGGGTYARNGVVAISATGYGEAFIRGSVAHEVGALMRYKNMPLPEACNQVIHGEILKMGGEGGLIALNSKGDICFSLNAQGMYRASINQEGNLSVELYGLQINKGN